MLSKNHAAARLETLESRLLLSSHLLDSAMPMSLAATDQVQIDGLVNTRTPVNYRFTASATSRLTADLLQAGGNLNPIVRLYNDRGRLLKSNDNAHRGTRDSQLVYNLVVGQTYVLQAAGRGTTAGEFRLGLCAAVIDDYGNRFDNAAFVRTSAGRGNITGIVDYNSDEDVFRLTATNNGSITLSRSALMARYGTNLCMNVYDAQGVPLAETTGAALSFNVTLGADYYLAVSGAGAGTGRYILNVVANAQPNVPAPPPPPAPPAPVIPPAAPPADNTPAIEPHNSVLAQVVQTGGQTQLWVLGTDTADVVTVTPVAGGLMVTAGTVAQTLAGAFAAIVMYGFGGGDTLTVASTVSLAATIYGGAGDDVIYAQGAGLDTVYGGDGDDLLVALGGGADKLYGEAGLDSFWADSTDTIGDASAAELAATAVHRVGAFYQPWTLNPANANYVPLTLAGQNLQDPQATTDATGWQNFAPAPVFANGPQFNDIAQGAIGDCYLLSVLSSVADSDPMYIRQMVTPLGDGTYAVRFHRNGQDVFVRVDGDLPVTGGGLTYARLSGQGELWAALIEKAYCFFRDGSNSYASINGGWMADVYPEIAAGTSSYQAVSSFGSGLAAWLSSQLDQGHPLTLGSRSASTGPIVGGHAYMIKSVTTEGGVSYVTVYNPWGWDGRTYDSNRYDGLLKIPTSQLATYFSTVMWSTM